MASNQPHNAETGLIPKSDFIGLENLVHLAAGGEAPMLKSHRRVIEEFLRDKASGEDSRHRMDDRTRACKAKVARILGVSAEDVAFLSTSSEGINVLVYGLNWRNGDNVVVCDVEFPSEVLPWTRLREHGVEIRVVRNRNWYVALDDLAAAVDAHTRLVVISDVSYFTGQRISIRALAEAVHAGGALLCVDCTHSAGVVPIEARYADIVVASCYKWLLGIHGVAIFYRNRDRLADLQPPFLGWHSGESIPDWSDPTSVRLRADAEKFEMGNLGYLGVYILDNALAQILEIGVPRIEQHVLRLGGLIWSGLTDLGLELMTPRPPSERAGNTCFMAPHIDGLTKWLAQRGILVWGGYAGVGRVRVSTHLYNSEADVHQFLDAMKALPDKLR